MEFKDRSPYLKNQGDFGINRNIMEFKVKIRRAERMIHTGINRNIMEFKDSICFVSKNVLK